MRIWPLLALLICGSARGAVVDSFLGSHSLGNTYGKTAISKTGQLVSTATTADQTVLTYTVTIGKTLYVSAIEIETRLTVLSATATILGACSWAVGGVKQNTFSFTNMTIEAVDRVVIPLAEPVPVASGVVFLIQCTPAAATSTTWNGNFTGFEK